MRKAIGFVVIALMAMIVLPAEAQLRFGVKGGVNISNVHFSSDLLNSDNVTGFHIGPMLETTLPLVGVGFDAAILYSQRGMGFASEDIRTDYIDIPVNFKWKLSLPLVKPYLAVGPYASFRVGGDKIWNIPGNVFDQFEAKTFGAGLNFGAGVEVLSHLQVGFVYTLGLTDNFKATVPGGDDEGGKNRGWMVTAAILF